MWEKAEIQIATVNGKILKTAYVLKDKGLAVHKDLKKRKLWVICHIKSGYTVNSFKFATMEKAKKYAERISAIEVNWNLTRSALCRKYGKNNLRIKVSDTMYLTD